MGLLAISEKNGQIRTHIHTNIHTHTKKKRQKDKKTKRSEWSEKGRGKIMEKGGGEGA